MPEPRQYQGILSTFHDVILNRRLLKPSNTQVNGVDPPGRGLSCRVHGNFINDTRDVLICMQIAAGLPFDNPLQDENNGTTRSSSLLTVGRNPWL
jgi:hypothetical protein